MFYNDLNPKRAKMVVHPKDYAWSSFHYYAYGKEDPLITPAPCYLLLGKDHKERQAAYRKMVEEVLKNDWKEKKPYSSVCFIGNPEWVRKRNQNLQELRQQKWIDWKERFRRKFAFGDSSRV